MSVWSLRWREKKSVTEAPYSIKLQSVTQLDTMVKSTTTETVLSWDHGGTAVAMAQNAQMTEEHSTLGQQTPGRLDHPAWCVAWTYDQRRRGSTPKTPAWTYVGSWVEGLSKVWRRRANKATIHYSSLFLKQFTGVAETMWLSKFFHTLTTFRKEVLPYIMIYTLIYLSVSPYFFILCFYVYLSGE